VRSLAGIGIVLGDFLGQINKKIKNKKMKIP
jgi:hypothetical protein